MNSKFNPIILAILFLVFTSLACQAMGGIQPKSTLYLRDLKPRKRKNRNSPPPPRCLHKALWSRLSLHRKAPEPYARDP